MSAIASIGANHLAPIARHDVAVLPLAEPAAYMDAGLSFRPHRPLEQIMIAGYVHVPRAREVPLICQLGETATARTVTVDNCPYMLFTAIARPGNSGGAIFSRDGRVVALVSRHFERQREGDDPFAPFPHFGAVPAEAVKEAVEQVAPEVEFPWETWEQ